jgi:GNAT superfamily N-acetyltransferase
MTSADLHAVGAIADRVHLAYPEDDAVLIERLALYPEGCAILELKGVVSGYAVTHPWRYREPPALNTLLGKLPHKPTTYYIHDFVVMPETRGSGAGSALANAVIAHAQSLALPSVSLVAVNKSVPFWSRFGFEVVSEPLLHARLLTYDADARFMARAL